MKRHADNETRIAAMRYHTQGPDKLYVPIRFLFVTERMCTEIAAERELILGLTEPAALARQRKLLEKYDPSRSADAFHSVLRLFGAGKPKA
jgi:hypothetical protein